VKPLRILLPCLLLVLPVMSRAVLAQTPDVITESKIMAIVDSIDRASRRGNLAGIASPLAKDVKIKWTISSPASPKEQVLYFNRDQFIFYTRQGLRKRTAYSLERKSTRVKIYDDGKSAAVIEEVYESISVPQGTLRGITSSVTTYSLRGGKILATSIDAKTRFL
jgi:hypothetical protein